MKCTRTYHADGSATYYDENGTRVSEEVGLANLVVSGSNTTTHARVQGMGSLHRESITESRQRFARMTRIARQAVAEGKTPDEAHRLAEAAERNPDKRLKEAAMGLGLNEVEAALFAEDKPASDAASELLKTIDQL